MSFEYLGCRIKRNQNHKEAPTGVLDDAHPDRRERGRTRQDASTFKEQTVFDIPKDCRSPNSEVTKRNEKLVRFYGDIAQHRYHRFNLKRGKAARRKLNKSWNKLLTLLEKARTYQDDVRKVNGKAVPIPSHFYKEV